MMKQSLWNAVIEDIAVVHALMPSTPILEFDDDEIRAGTLTLYRHKQHFRVQGTHPDLFVCVALLIHKHHCPRVIQLPEWEWTLAEAFVNRWLGYAPKIPQKTREHHMLEFEDYARKNLFGIYEPRTRTRNGLGFINEYLQDQWRTWRHARRKL